MERLLNVFRYFFWFILLFSSWYVFAEPYQVTESIKGVDIFKEDGLSPLPIITRAKKGDYLNSNHFLSTGPNSFCEIKKDLITIRLGSNVLSKWIGPRSWEIFEGSILICKDDEDNFQLSSKAGFATITGKCSFIAEVTSNGGFKFICLSGKPTITSGSSKSKIPAGRLVLVLGETDALGNAYDIDLLLLLKSSLLINAFEEPLPTMSKIGLAVYSQQLKIKGKYNALIGDATTDKNLQMWVLGKKGSDTKPSK